MSSYEQALKARIHSSIDYEGLRRYAMEHERRRDRPRTLKFKKLNVADKVFQWRQRNENLAADINHIRELARIVGASSGPLDPILVTPIGDKFYVVDGHHRMEAYRLAKWRKAIPVTYFEGSLEEAEEEAWRRNYKNSLPVTQDDKLEAAWRLVQQGGRTQQQIRDLTTISVRTIATMTKVLRERGFEVLTCH